STEAIGPRAEAAPSRPTARSGSAYPQPLPDDQPVRAPAPVAVRGSQPLEITAVLGQWDALVERLKTKGKPILPPALEHAAAAAVTASGVITIELDEPNDIYAHAIQTARAEIVAALRERFAGVERVELRRDENAPAAPPKRLTDEMIRAERIAALK